MRHLLILFLVISFCAISQEDYDTIKYKYRTGGELDSVDFSNATSVSTFVGGMINNLNQYSLLNYLTNSSGLNPYNYHKDFKPIKFSAIPHLGFSYSFGSQSIQFVHFDYQQVFGKTVLNMDLDRSSSNGVMRSSQFTKNDFSIQLNRKAKFYSFLIQANQYSNSHQLNGGFTDLTYINDQGLSFVPVLYSQANANHKQFEIKLVNFFNFIKDSISANSIGLKSTHFYKINQRVFTDNSLLSNYFIDSNTTNDQFRFAEMENRGGVYYHSSKLKFDGEIGHKFWDYQNIGQHMDTTELSVYSSLKYHAKFFNLSNDFKKNLSGAFGEFENKASVSVVKSDRAFKLVGEFGMLTPNLYQRKYFSNAYSYKINNIELQGRNKLGIEVNLTSNNIVKSFNFNGDLYQLNNNYFFIGDQWRNDTLTNFSIFNLSVNSDIQFKKLQIQPKYTLNYTNGISQIVPTSKFDLRLVLKSKLFKAKKLEGLIGVDFSAIGSYNLISFNSYVGVFSVEATQSNFNSMLNGSFFAGFSIDEFRMYLKFENIGYLFNDISNQTIQGYPIQPNFIRLGITWDFFN